MPIWPGVIPDAGLVAGPETTVVVEKLVAGKPWVAVEQVVRPTMTVYTPTGRNTGAAVIVFPGAMARARRAAGTCCAPCECWTDILRLRPTLPRRTGVGLSKYR